MKTKFDIAEEMAKNLNALEAEKYSHSVETSLAIDCLANASELLDNMNNEFSSKLVIAIISRLAKKVG